MAKRPYSTPKLQVITHSPQFLREAVAPTPAAPPADAAAWAALRELDRNALRELGLRAFNDPADNDFEGGKVLMLLPGEWYRAIPLGFELVSVMGRAFAFAPSVQRQDIRLGCLAFGLLVKP